MKRLMLPALCVAAIALAVPLAASGAKPPSPNSISLSAAPKIITFGQKDVLSGQLKGPNNGGVTVQLQQQPAPYTTAFKNVPGASVMTDNTGKYQFTVQPTLSTKYRSVAKTSPNLTSDALTLPVRFKVTLGLSDSTPRAGQRVTFSGSCAPANDGKLVYIQKRTSTGRYRTVKRTTLQHSASGNLSTYSTKITIGADGVFRARVLHDSMHATGTSRSRRATVH
jgi:hypothetical protein